MELSEILYEASNKCRSKCTCKGGITCRFCDAAIGLEIMADEVKGDEDNPEEMG